MESLITSSKKSAVNGMEQFLKVFSFVPDDKLDWTPARTAKSAMRIAAHTAIYPAVFAQMIRERKLPSDDIPGFVARMVAAEEGLSRISPPPTPSPRTLHRGEGVPGDRRAEMEGVFRKGTDEVVAALDTLTPEAIGMSLDSGLGWSMPMTFLMSLPGVHAYTHTGQIDYLQTCWGDQEVHF